MKMIYTIIILALLFVAGCAGTQAFRKSASQFQDAIYVLNTYFSLGLSEAIRNAESKCLDKQCREAYVRPWLEAKTALIRALETLKAAYIAEEAGSDPRLMYSCSLLYLRQSIKSAEKLKTGLPTEMQHLVGLLERAAEGTVCDL